MRILIADDDEPSRYLLRTVLEARRHKVITASDGEQAIELARRQAPDMIVADILMPNIDGYRLCRMWRDDPVLRDVPFVFYTATYTEAADEDLAFRMGCDAFLRKPLEPEILVTRLEEVGARRASRKRPKGDADTESELAICQSYNERLVRKLEAKVAELRNANERLRSAMELLSDEIDVKNNLILKLTEQLDDRRR